MSQVKLEAHTPAPSATGRARWAPLVYVLFFLSGLTSLIYEVIWVRQFGLVFGVTTYAVSTVLAAFFTGLALGSYGAGRIIDRGKLQPLLAYGLMEGAIGVYARKVDGYNVTTLGEVPSMALIETGNSVTKK